VPRRKPIDPHGWYHVGSRGCYGQTIFRTPDECELFLDYYGRAAKKYGWVTPEWVLMGNHHHFVIKLTHGGLSEGWREVHGTFSRQIHKKYSLTGQGHLVRHGFFARELTSAGDVLLTCRYVSLNHARAKGTAPAATPWGGYPAVIGLAHPRPFHSPTTLLELISESAPTARREYESFVLDGLVP
jgi:REP element-mobilizing transposase RayT